MENLSVDVGPPEGSGAVLPVEGSAMSRKDKRKMLKKLKRKQQRREMAIRRKEEEEARLNDPEEQLRLERLEEEEKERFERDRRLFEERERLWIEAVQKREEEEAERQKKLLEEANGDDMNREDDLEKSDGDNDEWEYVEEGPAEIIWKGNEIIVKKKTIKVPKTKTLTEAKKEDAERPSSNPLPPQSEAFSSHMNVATVPAEEVLSKMAQETPNFGTEQDKAHCPFHLKTGVCRFGLRCNRAHFYPEKSCTILIKNMYAGPGLAWELDEGLECTDEEVEQSYEEFYEDVHTEFLKFGELVNFKVCRNSSYHLRGNVYVHYKSVDSAVLAYESINGRYFAGKQITCDFVSVTRWKVAICGEYMKSKLKSCSRGSVCNFLHCFRNPGGDYEWADWDKPPPKYWVNKMISLFGFSDNKAIELGNCTERPRSSDSRRTPTSDRYDPRCKKESHDGDYVRDDIDLDRERRKRKRDSSRSDKHQIHDSDRYHSSRERSYDERHGSSYHKQKKRCEKVYYKEDSVKNKNESRRRQWYKEAKEVSEFEGSYGEEETDDRREKSKRHRDKYSHDSSDTESRRKHSSSKKKRNHRKKHHDDNDISSSRKHVRTRGEREHRKNHGEREKHDYADSGPEDLC